MDDASSLGDYLVALKHRADPQQLMIVGAIGAGVAALGLIAGAYFVPVTGLGVALLGGCTSIRLQQLGDAIATAGAPGSHHAGERRYRTLATAALVVGGAGALAMFFGVAFALVLGRFW